MKIKWDYIWKARTPCLQKLFLELLKYFLNKKYFTDKIFFNFLYCKTVSQVNMLLILNSERDGYKSKTFFNYKKKKMPGQCPHVVAPNKCQFCWWFCLPYSPSSLSHSLKYFSVLCISCKLAAGYLRFCDVSSCRCSAPMYISSLGTAKRWYFSIYF